MFFRKCMGSDITLSQYNCWNFVDDELVFSGTEEIYRDDWFDEIGRLDELDEFIDRVEDIWFAEYDDYFEKDFDWYGLELNWEWERWLESDPDDNGTLHFVELD